MKSILLYNLFQNWMKYVCDNPSSISASFKSFHISSWMFYDPAIRPLWKSVAINKWLWRKWTILFFPGWKYNILYEILILFSSWQTLSTIRECILHAWVKIFRINLEFKILRLTFHRKSASKCWIREMTIASMISFEIILTQFII